MKNAGAKEEYVTSIRLDRDLAYQARQLALNNKKAGVVDADSLTKILNKALADYLKAAKKRSA